MKLIAPMLTHLYQKSYETGTLPNTWTHATVCPIYKKGSRTLPENYRPISLTSIPCKIMEHIIVSQTWKHLNRHNIITSNQHGFRTGMSCETQLIEAIHDWTTILNNGQGQIDVILLDFSKAFDVVSHTCLLNKLHSYGITSETNRWIKSFLTSRTQEVLINGTSSNTAIVTSGVPQGTVLGPLLFLIYINDIEQQLQSNIRLFADDSALYREIKTKDDAKILQKDLFLLQNWADHWQMKFNIKKCKILKITKRTTHKINFKYAMATTSPCIEPTPQEILQIANTTLSLKTKPSGYSSLEEIDSDRYLGVYLDKNLNFNHHTDEISKKATKLLNLCRRNLHMCSPSIKETAYKAIVRPHLEFASSAWSPHTNRNINKLENVQRRAARFILNHYDYSENSNLSNKIKSSLKWQPLQHRRAIKDLTIFQKIRQNHININFPQIVNPSPIHPNRYLHVQVNHSEAFKYSYFVRTIRLWNTIPLKLCPNNISNPFFKNNISLWITDYHWSKTSGTWSLAKY